MAIINISNGSIFELPRPKITAQITSTPAPKTFPVCLSFAAAESEALSHSPAWWRSVPSRFPFRLPSRSQHPAPEATPVPANTIFLRSASVASTGQIVPASFLSARDSPVRADSSALNSTLFTSLISAGTKSPAFRMTHLQGPAPSFPHSAFCCPQNLRMGRRKLFQRVDRPVRPHLLYHPDHSVADYNNQNNDGIDIFAVAPDTRHKQETAAEASRISTIKSFELTPRNAEASSAASTPDFIPSVSGETLLYFGAAESALWIRPHLFGCFMPAYAVKLHLKTMPFRLDFSRGQCSAFRNIYCRIPLFMICPKGLAITRPYAIIKMYSFDSHVAVVTVSRRAFILSNKESCKIWKA